MIADIWTSQDKYNPTKSLQDVGINIFIFYTPFKWDILKHNEFLLKEPPKSEYVIGQ